MPTLPTSPDTPLERRRADWTRLAVMGDMHLFRLWVPPWRLLSKRLLGQINLWWDRRTTFRRELLPAMLQRVVTTQPDLFLLTGDLTMTALRQEFADVRAALGVMNGEVPTIAIAGNHDRYTPFSGRRRIMERCLPGLVPDAFPFWKELSPRWRLLAIDAAMPRLLTARGVIGRDQLRAVDLRIQSLTPQQGLVVMCHYPAIPKPDGSRTLWNHALADVRALVEILKRSPAPIVYLHGHVHKPWLVTRALPGLEQLVDVNVGAPIMRRADYPHGQGFWQIDLPDNVSDEVIYTQHVPTAMQAGGTGITLEWESREQTPVVLGAARV